jgi:Fe2+ transport system protein FeoA
MRIARVGRSEPRVVIRRRETLRLRVAVEYRLPYAIFLQDVDVIAPRQRAQDAVSVRVPNVEFALRRRRAQEIDVDLPMPVHRNRA